MVNLTTEAIFFTIKLFGLSLCQRAAIGSDLGLLLHPQSSLLGFELPCFLGTYVAITHPVGDAFLLLLFALIDLRAAGMMMGKPAC
jgi:hypothetical protein